MNKKLTVQEARELLRKYLSGQCTKREVEILDRWYHSFDHLSGSKMDLSETGEVEELKARMYESISDKIKQEEVVQEQGSKEAAVRKFYHVDIRTLRRMAAILIMGTGLGFFLYSQRDARLVEGQIAFGETHATLRESIGVDKKSPIYLSDGSVVWLKTGSMLAYPHRFTGNLREVSLTGEAFFDVAKDPEKPFIIHSGDLATRVLGTSFNIKAYSDQDSAEVVVVTGTVLVSVKEPSINKVKELVVAPHRKAIFSKKDHSLHESAVSAREVVVAADKRSLAFDEAPLRDIIKVLSAKYDAEIMLSNEAMEQCMITADLTNETLEISVAILSKAVQASYTIDGKNIKLHGKGCGTEP